MTDVKIETASQFQGKIHHAEPIMQRAFCFIGPPGTKKTLTLRTFMPPEWKEGDHPWARIFACDRKKDGGMTVLRGVKGIDYTVHVNSEAHQITSMHTPYTYPEPKALADFIEEANVVLGQGTSNTDFPYYLVALDTASGLRDIIFDEIFYKSRNPKMNPKVSAELRARIRPSQDDIGNCQWFMMQYVKALNQLPCVTVVVCHQYFVQEDIEGKMKIFPDLPGKKINDAFLSMFDEVFFFEADAKGEVKVRTRKTLTFPARTSQPALDTLESADYQVWKRKIMAYYEKQK
jgi:hypothetical protein